MAFSDELRVVLGQLDVEGCAYYGECLTDFDDGIEHVAEKVIDRRRWSVLTLDVYRRKADGALAGVRWDRPATEQQEGQDRDPQVVEVEEVMRPTYRIKAS